MFVLVGGLILLVVSPLLGLNYYAADSQPQLPDTYKDVFVAGVSGKTTLGTTKSTCWARGGICVDIKLCPSLKMDVSVPGCSWGHKVCCKVHQYTSPTVGNLRRHELPVIYKLEDLGTSLEIIALRNSLLMNNWHAPKPESEEISLYDLMNK